MNFYTRARRDSIVMRNVREWENGCYRSAYLPMSHDGGDVVIASPYYAAFLENDGDFAFDLLYSVDCPERNAPIYRKQKTDAERDCQIPLDAPQLDHLFLLTKSNKKALYDFGYKRPAVSALYLRDMLVLVGKNASLKWCGDPLKPILLKGESGVGFLLPCRKAERA